MKIFIFGRDLADEFAVFIEKAGFSIAETTIHADLIIDLSTEMSDKHQIMLEIPEVDLYTLVYPASATEIASFSPNPHRVIGFSAVSPINERTVIELAKPWQSDQVSLEKARQFFERIGFQTAIVPDNPGLVSARIIACLVNEAISALAENVADTETIDQAMKLGTNYPFGPLEWAEKIGLKAVLSILQGLFMEYGDDRYRPHPYLKRLVAADLTIKSIKI